LSLSYQKYEFGIRDPRSGIPESKRHPSSLNAISYRYKRLLMRMKRVQYQLKNHPSLAFRFPGVDWILGNHSDELTPWIPVMAFLSGMFKNFEVDEQILQLKVFLSLNV
jgi:hypothetical protein